MKSPRTSKQGYSYQSAASRELQLKSMSISRDRARKLARSMSLGPSINRLASVDEIGNSALVPPQLPNSGGDLNNKHADGPFDNSPGARSSEVSISVTL